MLFDTDVWPILDNEDLWIYDKCILSRKLGHLCGPSGIPVPVPNYYVVRPIVNLEGLGKGASIKYIHNETWNDVPIGYFWQELFKGNQYSVDYEKGKLKRVTQGFKKIDTLVYFKSWKIVDHVPQLPNCLNYFIHKYPNVNVEFINDKVIEVHLRGNPDFDDGAVEIIPVWEGSETKCPPGFIYVHDTTDELPRLGCFKKYN